MSNEYKDWLIDYKQDLETCLYKVYKDLNSLYVYEMQNEEPNQAVVDLILTDQRKILDTLGYTEEEIIEGRKLNNHD